MSLPDENELMAEIATKLGLTEDLERRLIISLIREIRSEALEDAAISCDHYADQTTFFRKAQAARECAKRIRELDHGQ